MNTLSPSDRMNHRDSLFSLSSSSPKKKRKEKKKSNNSSKLNLVILEDTDDEEFNEMMSISFKKVNNTENGREKCRPIKDTNNLKSNDMVETVEDPKLKETNPTVKQQSATANVEQGSDEKRKSIESNGHQLDPYEPVEKKRKAIPDNVVLDMETEKQTNVTENSTSPKAKSKNTSYSDSKLTKSESIKPNPNKSEPIKPTTVRTACVATDAKKIDPVDMASSEPAIKKRKTTFQDQVLQHLLTSMKPFTLKTLATDLKSTDVALHNLMLSLVDKRIILRKEFNSNKSGDGEKQKRSKEIYWIDIDRATQALQGSTGNMKSYSESERKKGLDEKARLFSEEAMIRKEIHELANVIPLDVLRKKEEEETQTVKTLKQRLDQIKNQQKSTSGAKQCPKTMQKKIMTLKNEWKKRKQQCMDFVENIADAMEKKKKDVLKDLLLELDD